MALRKTASGYLFQNWAGTQRALVSDVQWPSTEGEIAEALGRAWGRGLRTKIVGSGHSWSDAALPGSQAMSLDRLRGPVRVDHDTGEVTVWAGTKLHELNAFLARQGLAMPVLGSIAQQSVAGAISTGTHGSAPRLGNLASLVSSLRLVLPSGDVRELSASTPELFRAARVGLGALGVLSQVTFRCVPAFRLEEEGRSLSFDEALEELPSLLSREEFVKLWWLPHTDRVQVFCYRRTERPSTFAPAARWVDERLINGALFAGVLRAGAEAPGAIAGLNGAVGKLYFQPSRRVARSDQCFNIAMPPIHDEAEAAIDVEQTAGALRWMRRFLEAERLAVNFVVEVRFGAGDDAWLSPAHGRASCFLGAYTANPRDRDRFFDGFEEHMLAQGGRPHWGKAFRAGRRQLEKLYPRWADFDELRRQVDPRGLMLNPFLERVFVGG